MGTRSYLVQQPIKIRGWHLKCIEIVRAMEAMGNSSLKRLS
jgi:hypothetical protein